MRCLYWPAPLLALASYLWAANASATTDWAQAADAQKVDEERGWQTLLFMRDRTWRHATSMVDTPAFFLAPPAEWTPKAELHATLAAFLAPQDQHAPNEHPQCKFPARTHFLKAKLPGLAAALPRVTCPAFDKWQGALHTDKVYLVFSSSFAGNPASMFGHSFLRLKKRPVPGKVASDMLDDTANFTAYPTTDNPVLYVFLGLMGQFPGRFSMDPFFMKIQEYNNAESRDLWQYELAFDQDDIASLQRVLWEIGSQVIDYWYFDENCSFVILKVLEAVKPSLHFAEPHPWIIPSDTLREAVRAPGLVKEIEFRASALTRFLATYQSLTDDERSVVDRMVAANEAEEAEGALGFLGPNSRARVIDAVLEFIDYDENLAGSKEAKKFKELRRSLLRIRVGLRIPKEAVAIPSPATTMPHLTHGTTRIGAGAGYSPLTGALGQLEWRPALHDLASPDYGYSEGLSITFFDTTVRYAAKPAKLYVDRWDLLTVLSVPHLPPIVRPFAWSLEIGTENRGACADVTLRCHEEHLRGGYGPIFDLGPVRSYVLAKGEAGADGGFGRFVGVGAGGGLLLPIDPRLKVSLGGTAMRRFGEGKTTTRYERATFTASKLLSDATELRMELSHRNTGNEGLMAFDYFY